MSIDVSHWSGVPRPQRIVLDGKYARLEPLSLHHEAHLLHSALQPGADDRFRYLFEHAPAERGTFRAWLERAAASDDPLFFSVIDRRSGRAEGRQALMRIDTVHGVIEIGNILWGPASAKTRIATEALYLFAQYVFDELGYRRFEWKCHNLNEPSKRAAERFGFIFEGVFRHHEGVFRHHMVIKGQNRDTAWFAMTDDDWPRIKTGYVAWLAPENFDDGGQQKTRLTIPRAQ